MTSTMCDPAAQILRDNEFIDDETLVKIQKIIMPLLMYVEVSRMQCRTLSLSQIAENPSMRWIINYDPDSEQIDKFRDSAKRVEEFECTLLCPHDLENQDSFYYTTPYAICYQLKNKKDECQNEDQLKEDIGNIYYALSNSKENLRLDLDIKSFENQYHSVNELLNKKWAVFESLWTEG